jgi:serine/threonine-protein kinase
MGEVYRADDLKLGQPVALKFLPEEVASDPRRLERFYSEVRLGRQITHPNVCRVYDIGEVGGQHFISMEFVDGEDLAALQRRIGRLSEEKAVQIARQLCAGLVAAHSQGILHRDLKPANIMIDGRGRVRITDFGLAALADEIGVTEARAGTPTYMAPEQLRGEEVSVLSDVYSLGLILFELFTGEQARKGRSYIELLRESQQSPVSPASRAGVMSSRIEDLILCCLQPDPEDRPESVLAIAASLPGGDPLAEALAAGETPSPEMVAAARIAMGLSPLKAAILIASFFVLAVSILWVQQRVHLLSYFDLPKRPEVLESDAQRLLIELGFSPTSNMDRGFTWDSDFFTAVQQGGAERSRDDSKNEPSVLRFWYRQSPEALVPMNYAGWVTPDDPPSLLPGMISVVLDPSGRLLELLCIPDQKEEPAPDLPVDGDPWNGLFAWSGFDREKLRPVLPVLRPPMQCDQRAAWTGKYSGPQGLEVRIEAGSIRGTPHFFRVIPPWSPMLAKGAAATAQGSGAERTYGLILLAVMTLGSLALVRRNLKSGRGDRKGALRLSFFVLILFLVFWLFRADHVLGSAEISMLQWALGSALLLAVIVWVLYLALEPYVRRFWPNTIVSWTRLMAGNVRDPLVGRDILVGSVAGLSIALILGLSRFAGITFLEPGTYPMLTPLETLTSVRHGASLLFSRLTNSVVSPLALIVLILLLRVLLRKQWLALASVWVLFVGLELVNMNEGPISSSAGPIVWALAIFVMIRFGLVSSVVMFYFAGIPFLFPVTTDWSVWYNSRSIPLLLILGSIVVYAFYLSLAGRPLFKEDLIDG